MKCTNKIIALSLTIILSFSFTGCKDVSYDMAYDRNSDVSAFRFFSVTSDASAVAFADDLCVASKDVSGNSADIADSSSALLCDIKGTEVLYAKNIHEHLEPASLTKVMTALVALRYGSLDDVYTASENVLIDEPGATLIGLKAGDTMTLDQALHGLMISSGNDAAILIAEGIAGSVEAFCNLMNEDAKSLGATNCNFMNPHGLTQENHYVTAYDMYLIFKEATENDEFNQIINASTYSSVYKDREGESKELICETTNQYLTGDKTPPDNVKVIGGKTGTTASARNCLVIYAKDNAGKSYIAVLLKCSERDILYEEMTELLSEIVG